MHFKTFQVYSSYKYRSCEDILEAYFKTFQVYSSLLSQRFPTPVLYSFQNFSSL